MTKYTIKATTPGNQIYYLVNGWKKHNAFWIGESVLVVRPELADQCFFNKPSQAKSSLTKLLKIMPEYGEDTFEVVEFAC